MIATELPLRSAEEAVRVVRALGTHRYVVGRMHLVHAFVFASIDGDASPALADARAWAEEVLGDPDIDASSKDERLYRRATDAELVAALEAFWVPGVSSSRARARLTERLARAELPIANTEPFDDDAEDDVHPILIDAGWELLPLAELDAVRHRGAIDAFGEAILFEAARFEEESAIPPLVYLHELPAVGPVELLRGVDDEGAMRAPFTLWLEGNATYHDYVVRGVARAAKLDVR
jgi:hypothetical protein